jgi:hypothetical protein
MPGGAPTPVPAVDAGLRKKKYQPMKPMMRTAATITVIRTGLLTSWLAIVSPPLPSSLSERATSNSPSGSAGGVRPRPDSLSGARIL